jgi:hypothetical protein
VFYDVSDRPVEMLAIVVNLRPNHGCRCSEVRNEGSVGVGDQGWSLALSARSEKAGDFITRHGKPVGVMIGFESEDAWFEYRLAADPRFLRRIEAARSSIRAGRGVRLEDVG